MGCSSSLLSPYTAEEVEGEIAKIVARLPMAEQMNGGIIKLQGPNGFFNPNSLLDPNWLKGAMTADEYRDAINYINKCTAHTHVGLKKIFTPSDMPVREKLKSDAGMAAVQYLNDRYRSVRFTYQPTNENAQINIAANTDTAARYAKRRGERVAHAPITNLFIAIQ